MVNAVKKYKAGTAERRKKINEIEAQFKIDRTGFKEKHVKLAKEEENLLKSPKPKRKGRKKAP